jgi:hypothetical protein
VQAGHNFMLSPMWLAGFEVDIQGSTLRGSANGANTVRVDTVAGPGTGTFTTNIATSRGLDYIGTVMASGKWSIKGEYLYYDLGTANYGTGGYGVDEGPSSLPGVGVAGIAASTRVRFNGNIARVGLNYHLN